MAEELLKRNKKIFSEAEGEGEWSKGLKRFQEGHIRKDRMQVQ
jgi:hypothetical protein